MTSKNVSTALAVYECFNKRHIDGAVEYADENLIWDDHGLNVTHKGRAEWRASLESWIAGFSDGQAVDPKATDAGDTVIVQFTARGTNDGPMGPFLKPTGRSISVPFVDVVHFDEQGRIVRGSTYFDMLSMLVQLGHAERPGTK
jgi:steroid delta-isomerase-like uncharacterized protein